MNVSVEITFNQPLRTMDKTLKRGIVLGLGACAAVTANEIKRLPQSESFVDRTPRLRNSIIPTKVNIPDLSVEVVADTDYAGYVDSGTRYIKPRQYMKKGLKKVIGGFGTIMENALRRVGFNG